jgi:hypothetical protein
VAFAARGVAFPTGGVAFAARGGVAFAARGVAFAARGGVAFAARGVAFAAVGAAAGFLALLDFGAAAAFTTAGSCAWVSMGGAPAGAGRFSLRRWGRVRGRDPITPGLGCLLIEDQSLRTDREARRSPKISFYR